MERQASEESDSLNTDRWAHLARKMNSVSGSIGISLEWDGPDTPVLRASNKVGVLSLSDAGEQNVQVTVRPKVEGSVSGMLRAVLELERDRSLSWEERPATGGERPSAWLAGLFARQLDHFLHRMRKRDVEQEEPLREKIRGRPLVTQYLKRNYWTQPEVVPCRYVEWSVDNLPNQILRHGVAVAQKAIAPYGGEAIEVQRRLQRCRAALSGVSRTRVRRGDFQRVRPMLKGAFRAYEPMIHIAEILITALDPFSEEDRRQSNLPVVRAFQSGESDDGRLRWDLVDMPTLFEEYVRRISRSKKEESSGNNPPIELEGTLPGTLDGLQGKTLELDVRPIGLASGGLVVDAKYKYIGNVERSDIPRREARRIYLAEHDSLDLSQGVASSLKRDEGTRQVTSSDLYQVLAYATHKNVEAQQAALVYPIADGGDRPPLDDIPRYGNLGATCTSGDDLPIYVFTVRVDKEGIREELAGGDSGLWSQIQTLR